MYVCIQGEKILNDINHLDYIWNNELTKEDCEKIIKELS